MMRRGMSESPLRVVKCRKLHNEQLLSGLCRKADAGTTHALGLDPGVGAGSREEKRIRKTAR
jgi:hypothetical protein